jgi:cytochrome c oxidase subunit 4
MTAATDTHDHTGHNHDEHGHDEHDHAEHGMSTAGYIKVALILAAMTALEVSTYYIDFGPFFMPVLLILMCVKFFIVVSYFMHLKFDSKLFSFLFYAGLFLAIIVYVIALATFKFFTP